MKNNLLFGLLILFQINVFAQNFNSENRKGVKLYKDSLFSQSEEKFSEALLKNQDSFIPSYNLANAVYKQSDFERSESLFNGLTQKTENKKQKSMAFHNLGNSLFNQDKIEESIEAYKNALRNDPSDFDSKYNLSLALKRLKEQQENKEEEKEEEEKEEEKEEEEKEEKEEKEKEEENKQEDPSQNQEPQDQQEPEQPKDPNEMSQQEAQQMLDALENKERELQEELQKKKGKVVKLKIEKDW